jgi:hypothetical protein
MIKLPVYCVFLALIFLLEIPAFTASIDFINKTSGNSWKYFYSHRAYAYVPFSLYYDTTTIHLINIQSFSSVNPNDLIFTFEDSTKLIPIAPDTDTVLTIGIFSDTLILPSLNDTLKMDIFSPGKLPWYGLSTMPTDSCKKSYILGDSLYTYSTSQQSFHYNGPPHMNLLAFAQNIGLLEHIYYFNSFHTGGGVFKYDSLILLSFNNKPLDYPLTIDRGQRPSNKSFCQITALPNPTANRFAVSVYAANQSKLNISLHDLRGRVLFENHTNCSNRFTSLQVDLSKYASGVYLLSVSSPNTMIKKSICIFKN